MLERGAAKGELADDLDFEQLLQWILHCQLLLTVSYRRLEAAGLDLRQFVRRFMVLPVLASWSNGATPEASSNEELESLRAENAMLRALVSDQALELFRLRDGPRPS